MTHLRLGGHIGASSGLRHLVINTRALDYDVVQTMIGDKRGYDPLEISGADAAELKKMLYGVDLYVHLPYTINPCEALPQKRGWYKRTYNAFMAAASNLGAKGVVIHPGYKKELSEEQALANLIKFFETSWQDDWNCDVLIETDSGSKNGSAIGSADFIDRALTAMDHPRHAMCIDTEHLFARGTDLWNEEVRTPFLAKYGHRIRLVHLNSPDPQVELGSFLDRHNTPFQDRAEWDHKGLFDALLPYPWILERSSLAVQEQDAQFIRTLFADEGATRGRYARTDARATEKRR